MDKPSIDQIAEMMEPPAEGEDMVTIPGYGQIQVSQARTEAIARLRMIADALEAGKNVPLSAVDIAVNFLKHIPEPAQDVDRAPVRRAAKLPYPRHKLGLDF